MEQMNLRKSKPTPLGGGDRYVNRPAWEKALGRVGRTLLAMRRRQKVALQMLADFSAVALATLLVTAVGIDVPAAASLALAAVSPIFAVLLLHAQGVYRAWVRFLDPKAGFALFLTAIATTSMLGVVVVATGAKANVFTFIDSAALTFLGLIGPRLAFRGLLLWIQQHQRDDVAIYGAGSAGRELAAALKTGGRYRVCAFLDDDRRLHNSSVAGVAVHSPKRLGQLVDQGVTRVLLAMPRISISRRREVVEALAEHAVAVQTIPSFDDLVRGDTGVTQLRDLSPLDLLGRDVVPPVRELIEHDVRNRVVLVSGAGGSIGSELCRQIVAQRVAHLVLLDHSEHALYDIHQEMLARVKDTEVRVSAVLASICDSGAMRRTLHKYDVETVYHAAAYKHVPIVEENVLSGLHNNIVGTWSLANAAAQVGVESFVLISTDKAVRPTNIMGATKRAAELAVQALAKVHARTRFSMVRFGNVLDSSGSVVPLFRRQISDGGPVTVTHTNVIRYFMTIPEAAQLVLQAGAMGRKAEVFVLDMGQPVNIYELAQRMIRLAGLEPRLPGDSGGDIPIEVTGLRPGEKLYEELLVSGEETTTRHPRICLANEPSVSLAEFEEVLHSIRTEAEAGNETEAVSALLSLPIDYRGEAHPIPPALPAEASRPPVVQQVH